MSISFLTSTTSTFGIFITSVYIFWRTVNYGPTVRIKATAILWCLAWTFFDALNLHWTSFLMLRYAFCAATIVFHLAFCKLKLDTVVLAFFLSYGISFVLFPFAVLAVSFVFILFLGADFANGPQVDLNNPIYLLFYALAAAIQFSAAHFFFKIRRFKLGFPFLSGKHTATMTLIFTGTVLVITSLIVGMRERYDAYITGLPLVTGIAVLGMGIYIWIRRSLKVFQHEKAWERNEEIFLQEKEELAHKLRHYKEIHETVRVANHKMMHRQAAAERNVLRLLEKAREYGLPDEFCGELAAELHNIRKLAKEYQGNVGLETNKRLPSTNIQAIDNMFGLFADCFATHAIDFNLKVNGSIIYMAENIIEHGKLETMIGDHLQNALVAVNAGDGVIRNVLAMIGEVEDCYEFSIHDSGIPFKPSTLAQLGTQRITTHASGSGIGFMTTFEAMRECGASLTIRETHRVPASQKSSPSALTASTGI
ncbi:MAG: hypothetical protein FWB97_08350 [Oscillospiraceae bacterium]|nr:hypothetical protein [Oscillospiraceae bacterium]